MTSCHIMTLCWVCVNAEEAAIFAITRREVGSLGVGPVQRGVAVELDGARQELPEPCIAFVEDDSLHITTLWIPNGEVLPRWHLSDTTPVRPLRDGIHRWQAHCRRLRVC